MGMICKIRVRQTHDLDRGDFQSLPPVQTVLCSVSAFPFPGERPVGSGRTHPTLTAAWPSSQPSGGQLRFLGFREQAGGLPQQSHPTDCPPTLQDTVTHVCSMEAAAVSQGHWLRVWPRPGF